MGKVRENARRPADMAQVAAGQHGWLRRADLGDLRSRWCGWQIEPAPRRGCPV